LRLRGRVAVWEHAAERQEHPRHAEPGIAEQAGKRSQPPERQARCRDECVRVQEARQRDVHEETLRRTLCLSERPVLHPTRRGECRKRLTRIQLPSV